MAYNPTNWKDRVVERPLTFNMQENPDGTVTLIPAPGAVLETGTPVNAANLNKLEQGLKTHEADYATFKNSKGQPNGLAELDSGGQIPSSQLSNVPEPVKPYVTGTYTGDKSASRTINLGFRPKAVLVMCRGTRVGFYNSKAYGGLALDGSNAENMGSYSGTTIRVVNNGFNVYYDGNNNIYTNATDADGGRYHYIAWR